MSSGHHHHEMPFENFRVILQTGTARERTTQAKVRSSLNDKLLRIRTGRRKP